MGGWLYHVPGVLVGVLMAVAGYLGDGHYELGVTWAVAYLTGASLTSAIRQGPRNTPRPRGRSTPRRS